MKVTVKIYENGNLLVDKVFDEGVYRGGRSEFADINLPSDSISRSHFELRVSSNNVYLTNMSAVGRIKVNGKQVETSEIKDGDTIVIGPYQIIVAFGESAGLDAPAVSGLDLPASDGEAPASDLVGSDGEPIPEPLPDLPPPDMGGDSADGDPLVGAGTASSPFKRQFSQDVEGTAALVRAETVVESKPVVAKLMFTEGPRKGDELFIEAYEITIGRSRKADIFLDDEKLSRIHAKIARVGIGFRLIDQQSRNGTYVNGMRVLEHPLSSFDTIDIGNSKIRFLIHDMAGGDLNRMSVGKTSLVESPGSKAVPFEVTRSLQLSDTERRNLLTLQEPGPPAPPPINQPLPSEDTRPKKGPSRAILLVGVLLGLMGIYYFMSGSPPPAATTPSTTTPTVTTKTSDKPVNPVAPSSVLSKEFQELSPELQRAVEGYYNTALRAGDRELYPEAIENIQKIHDIIPYYKESMSLMEMYQKRLREKQAQIANEKAKKDDKQELPILIEDGTQYLKDGDWEKAAEAFNYAIQIDPSNPTVKKGLKAADMHIRDLEKVPDDVDPLKQKEQQIRELFRKALQALDEGKYQDAIVMAEDIKKIELPGRTDYINEATQIIEKARAKQKEQFEPFLIDAKGKYSEGDFNASRDLCEEMLRKDPSFTEARECLTKAKNQLNKLAKEAYTLGYILENMNRIEEAKQYWNRAKNYVRPGDPYYEKVMNKLDQYQ